MNSCLYDCRVHHARSRPSKHHFNYRLFMFYIDLDEEPLLASSLKLIGNSSWTPYQLKKSDHYDEGGSSIKENITNFLRKSGYSSEIVGKIRLLTHLRAFGHIFNPVSFYFVDRVAGGPLCAIAEVANTFNEQKLFLVKPNADGSLSQNQSKRFYVSPFSDLDTTFHFKLKEPRESLRIVIDQSEASESKPFFKSALVGKSVPLTDSKLLAYTFRFPIITFRILASIHWQALLLWLKGHRVRRKAARPDLQTGKRTYLKPNNHINL